MPLVCGHLPCGLVSGLAVAAVSVLGVVFAWRLIDLTDPEWAHRVADAVKVSVSWVLSWVPRWARQAAVAPALISLGGIALVVGTVLPLGQSDLFTQTRDNALIDHGGWALIGLAVIAVTAGFRDYRTGARSWGPLLLGFISLGIVVGMATDATLRSGYQYGLGALGIPPDKVVLPVGSGPYVAAAGAALVLLGGWILRNAGRARQRYPNRATPRLKADG